MWVRLMVDQTVLILSCTCLSVQFFLYEAFLRSEHQQNIILFHFECIQMRIQENVRKEVFYRSIVSLLKCILSYS